MDRFKITQKYNQDSFISWDETSRVLTLADTGEVTLKMEPTSREDSEGNTILKDYKFDIFNVDTGGSFDFYKVDNKGKEIEGTRTSTSPKTSYTVKGKPGYKGNIYWVEFFKDKSKFETSKDSLDSHQLGLFIIFKRPAPIIESVTWLDPKTKLPVKEKSLGQYAILRIESKHLENETIRVSLWDYDGNLTSLVTKISGSPNLVYPHVGDKGGSGYTYTQVSREY
ncbi:MAG: hypothetical protein ABJD66_11775, partial [Cellulophaga sp.]|uniref:hypothetical protein n=1 Tax=Cellulophaga sp. TaxID=1972202 RepID=UPI003266D962